MSGSGLLSRIRRASSPFGNRALNAGPLEVLLSAPWASSATCRAPPARLPNHEGNGLSQDLVRGQEFCAKAASSCHNDAIGWISVRKFFGDRTHRDGSSHGNLIDSEASQEGLSPSFRCVGQRKLPFPRLDCDLPGRDGGNVQCHGRVGENATSVCAQRILLASEPKHDAGVENDRRHGRRSEGQSSSDTGVVGSSGRLQNAAPFGEVGNPN